MRKSSTLFIISEDYLKISDYFSALIYPLKVILGPRIIGIPFRNFDVSDLLEEEQLRHVTYDLQSVLIYRLFLRLGKAGLQPDLIINWYGGIPYSQNPDSVELFIKYSVINNAVIHDTAYMLVNFKKSGLPLCFKWIPIATGTQISNFQKIKIKLPPLAQTPDSVIFGFINTSIHQLLQNDGNPLPSSNANYIIIDDIRFIGAGITQQLPNNDFEQWDVIKKYKLDLIHFTHFNVPLLFKKRFIVTIHDLIITHHPDSRATTLSPILYKIKLFFYGLIIKSTAKRADKIITVSQYSKKDIIHTLGASADKIFVTYEGIDAQIAIKENYESILSKFNLTQNNYLLYIGSAYPHKNLERLISAFDQIIKSRDDLKLVLVGKKDFFYTGLEKYIKETGKKTELERT